MSLVRILKNFIKTWTLYKYYDSKSQRAKNEEQWIIYMADGKMHHGGLSDRLCGLVSTYCYCLEHHKIFKAYFKYPYELETFLLPNKCNWRIDISDISYNVADSIPVYIPHCKDVLRQIAQADKKLNLKCKQIHVYTNMRYFKENFSRLFSDLFRTSFLLQDVIDLNRGKLPYKYVSITFRFQQLLGDFSEGNFPIIKSEESKKKLINECLECVDKVRSLNPDIEKILVTSDSSTFLNEVKKKDYIYVIPGDVVHLDFLKEKVDMRIHMKSFVDLFLIANASKIYLANLPPLYKSSFPKTASYLYGVEYVEIDN